MKPKKKKGITYKGDVCKCSAVDRYKLGYNHAIDDYEAYHNEVIEKLADEGEIAQILFDWLRFNTDFAIGKKDDENSVCDDLAKAISKRIKEAL